MKEKNQTRDAKKDLLYVAVVLLVLGLLFVLFPNVSVILVCYILGAVLCIWGIIRTYLYFKSDKMIAFGSYGLLKGLALLLVGVLVLANPQFLAGMLTMVLGVLMILDGVVKLQYALDLMRIRAKGWLAVLILAVVMTVLGIVAVCNPFDTAAGLMVFSGAVMLAEGIMDLVMYFYLKKSIKAAWEIAD